MARFTWVVRFSVSKKWVADGFDLNDEKAKGLLANRLMYAYGHEYSAKVLKHPEKKRIRKAQGY